MKKISFFLVCFGLLMLLASCQPRYVFFPVTPPLCETEDPSSEEKLISLGDIEVSTGQTVTTFNDPFTAGTEDYYMSGFAGNGAGNSIRNNYRINPDTNELELFGGGLQLQFDNDPSNDPSGSSNFSYNLDLDKASYTISVYGKLLKTFDLDDFTSPLMAVGIATKRPAADGTTSLQNGLEGGFRIYKAEGTNDLLITRHGGSYQEIENDKTTPKTISLGDYFKVEATISADGENYKMNTVLYVNGQNVFQYETNHNNDYPNTGRPETFYLTMFGPYKDTNGQNYIGKGPLYMTIDSVSLSKTGV